MYGVAYSEGVACSDETLYLLSLEKPCFQTRVTHGRNSRDRVSCDTAVTGFERACSLGSHPNHHHERPTLKTKSRWYMVTPPPIPNTQRLSTENMGTSSPWAQHGAGPQEQMPVLSSSSNVGTVSGFLWKAWKTSSCTPLPSAGSRDRKMAGASLEGCKHTLSRVHLLCQGG